MESGKADQKASRGEDVFFDVLNNFPVPIIIFNAEGTTTYLNKEFMDCFHILDSFDIIGKFNILEDTFVNDNFGFSELLQRSFSGEILSFTNIRIPFKDIAYKFGLHTNKNMYIEMYQDIITFPFLNNDGSIENIIFVFITRHIYQSRLDTIKAKEYIDNHWMEDFNLDEVARHAGLCRHYLSRLFKSYFGMTPYAYYQELKIRKIMEALGNFDLSISEAFLVCGADYSGGIADVFKRKTKMTPSSYRKALYNRQLEKKQDLEQADAYIPNSRVAEPDIEKRILQIAELFPIPMQIYKKNGDIAFVNDVLLKMWNILDTNQIMGKYNVFRDPLANEHPEIYNGLKRVFKGEIVLFSDVKVPLKSFWEWNEIRSESYDVEAFYTDILNFPINDSKGQMIYMVSIFFTSRIYRGKSEVARAREYIENNWNKEFDIVKISKAACLSPSHLIRLFKKYTGMTPYKYYQEIKVIKLKEALRDKNLSIAEAFSSCGFDYSGNYARFFKIKVGMTPSQYRKAHS